MNQININLDKTLTRDESIRAYIGKSKKASWYAKAFNHYEKNGKTKFRWYWSSSAFLGGPFYLMYRKCYFQALILTITLWGFDKIFSDIFALVYSPNSKFFTPLSILISSIIVDFLPAGILPYFVYKRYRKSFNYVEEFKRDDKESKLKTLRAKGGVNRWAILLYIIPILLTSFTILGITGFTLTNLGLI